MIYRRARGAYAVSTDPALLDLDVVHEFLCQAYWSPGVPRNLVAKSMRNALCFGLYHGENQIGYAAAVTDRVHFAYLKDVFVLPAHQGQGLGSWLLECILEHPELQALSRILLATSTAHEFYRRYGFTELQDPPRWMEKTLTPKWRKAPGSATPGDSVNH
jgi:GNAT superfamily N-acetyltransferase